MHARQQNTPSCERRMCACSTVDGRARGVVGIGCFLAGAGAPWQKVVVCTFIAAGELESCERENELRPWLSPSLGSALVRAEGTGDNQGSKNEPPYSASQQTYPRGGRLVALARLILTCSLSNVRSCLPSQVRMLYVGTAHTAH